LGDISPVEKGSYRCGDSPKKREQASDQPWLTNVDEPFQRSEVVGRLFHGVRSFWDIWRRTKTAHGDTDANFFQQQFFLIASKSAACYQADCTHPAVIKVEGECPLSEQQ